MASSSTSSHMHTHCKPQAAYVMFAVQVESPLSLSFPWSIAHVTAGLSDRINVLEDENTEELVSTVLGTLRMRSTCLWKPSIIRARF